MQENGNEAAFSVHCGLSKRELIAAMVLQGFAASPEPIKEPWDVAVEWADDLLKSLEPKS